MTGRVLSSFANVRTHRLTHHIVKVLEKRHLEIAVPRVGDTRDGECYEISTKRVG